MLNEERIRLMTQMASYEAGEGRKNMAVGRYFRSDYIAWQLLKAFFFGTLSFGLVFGMYVLYDLEALMENLYQIDLLAFAKRILTYYAFSVAGYLALTYVVCASRYSRARRSLKRYYQNLKRLNGMYHKQ